MSSNWFSNRGQASQLALTAFGVIFSGINAWPAISQFQLLKIAPIVFYLLIGLLLLFVVRQSRRPERSNDSIDTNAVSTGSGVQDPSNVVTAPRSTLSRKADEPDHFLDRDLQKFKLQIGEAWRSQDRRVVLHGIRKNDEKPRSFLFPESDYIADLEVSFGGRLIFAGPSVKEAQNFHFLIPNSPSSHNAEPGALYAFSYSSEHMNFEFLTIEHINFFKNEVEVVFGRIRILNREGAT